MTWKLAAGFCAAIAWAQPAAPDDPAAELAPLVKKFVDVLTLVREHASDPITLEPAMNQGALPGALRQLDPHSIYFDPDQFRQLQEMEQSVQRGFGTIVSILPGRVVILQTQNGSPAARAGLSPGDEILAINGYVLAQLDTEQLIGLLGQARQQKVKLDVRRQNTPRLLEFMLSPETMNAPSVDRVFALEPGIGYLRVSSFEKNTGAEVQAGIEKLGGRQLRGLVLDLRNNGGGVLQAALEAASLFLKPGQTIISVRGRSKKTEQIDVPAKANPYLFPVVVLVNEKSASASEVLASALQDHGRAAIVGEPTFGKGLVQSVFPLHGGTGLALTVALYYSPKGRSIQRPLRNNQLAGATQQQAAGGIIPDIVARPEASNRLRMVLEGTASFTAFATEFVRGKTVERGFRISGPVLDEYRSWLAARNIQPAVREWTADLGWIRSRLEQEIVTLGLGVEQGDEIELARDPAVIRAIEEIRRR